MGQLTSGIAASNWWRDQKYYDSGDWRGTWRWDGGGALMNQAVHMVDLLVAALGTPVHVFACTACRETRCTCTEVLKPLHPVGEDPGSWPIHTGSSSRTSGPQPGAMKTSGWD
ncbi:Gfo/Idh/MocA family oxidoreductase [Arthrobacter sp. R4]|uniref:Gfo/Idh/MocA family protein n=1 Tax=Arthrobacter sp. R4 TaxID=644417 RepID=UPI003EDB1B9E